MNGTAIVYSTDCYCISGVFIVMFFCDMCSCILFALYFSLMVSIPSFYLHGFFSFVLWFIHNSIITVVQCVSTNYTSTQHHWKDVSWIYLFRNKYGIWMLFKKNCIFSFATCSAIVRFETCHLPICNHQFVASKL
jgi:hypothetical protein